MTPVFFYGLFMDESLLREKGLTPAEPVIAYVDGYALRIGDRASLVPARGEHTYGVVMALDNEQIAFLYADKSVADYAPETITAFTLANDVIQAITYVLPQDKLAGQNMQYLRTLIRTARKVGLPEVYIHRLELQENTA